MKTNRFLAILLSIVMIFSLLPHAFAMEDLAALQAQMQAMRLLIGAGTTTAADREALREAIESAELALQNATGINGVAAFSKGDGTIFNLSGQRVSKPGKGIYIVNGRKVLY